MPVQDRTLADTVPWFNNITPYDEDRLAIYIRDPKGTHHCGQDQLKRAEWMTTIGYRRLFVGERDALQ